MEKAHFRRCTWGMTRSEVMEREDAKLVTEANDGTLLYEGTLIGSRCNIFYNFDADGKLCTGTYQFDDTNDVADVNDFLRLADMLTEKYGEPDISDAEWALPQRQRPFTSISEAAKAIANGEVTFERVWTREDVHVRLVISEDTEQFNALVHLLYYDPVALRRRVEERTASDFDLI